MRQDAHSYAHQRISALIRSRRPFLLGRVGLGAETWAACLAAQSDRLPLWRRSIPKDELGVPWQYLVHDLYLKNGIAVLTLSDALAFGERYLAAVRAADVLARYVDGERLWTLQTNPSKARHHKGKNVTRCGGWPDNYLRTELLLGYANRSTCDTVPLSVVSAPWAAGAADEWTVTRNVSWLRALRNLTVLVVHPFNRTIASQLARGATTFWGSDSESVLPSSVTFKLVRPPVNFAGTSEASHFDFEWRKALHDLVRRVDAAGPFDVALLACGGLGMLLGAHLRATNRSSVYMGGALQLLFGIKGHRWESAKSSSHADDAARKAVLARFVCPSGEETPPAAGQAENSAYWCKPSKSWGPSSAPPSNRSRATTSKSSAAAHM